MKFLSIDDCSAALVELTQNKRQQHGGKLTTDLAARLAEFVGSPHKKLNVIHIAGTSGKTSTSYYVSSLLQASGLKVGLTVSPHIHSIAERALVNGRTLEDEVYLAYFREFYSYVHESGLAVSYFEFMMVFALWVFMKEDVDYAVIETGLGGLYDASNICQQPNKLCLITDIGLDHTHVLGNSLYEIATQKAGIVWKGNTVVAYRQSNDVTRVIEERVAEQGAVWVKAEMQQFDDASSLPRFQQRNWHLAFKAYQTIARRDGLDELSEEQVAGTQHTEVPARMEHYSVNGKVIIIDGAHNEQKMQTFFDSFTRLYPGIRPSVLLSLKEGKDLEAIAPLIASHASNVIATEFTVEQDMPTGARSADEIATYLRSHGMSDVSVQQGTQKALDIMLDAKSDMILVIGSFFLASEVSKLLKKKQLLAR